MKHFIYTFTVLSVMIFMLSVTGCSSKKKDAADTSQKAETAAAVQNEETESAVQNEETESAVQNEETESSVQNEETESAVQNEETESAVQNEETESAVQNEETESAVQNEETEKSTSYKQISQEEAKEMMAKDDGHIIADVRRIDEYEEGHIPGAVCIPNETITDTQPGELPDLDQIILVYCRSGNRSKQAAQKLFDIGYTNIYEFGGIIDWTGEVVTD